MVAATEGRTVPKITLYVKDSYAETWERARRLSNDSDESLSSMVSEVLAAAVEEKEKALQEAKEQRDAVEELKGSMERIELAIDEPRKQVVRFEGVELAGDEDVTIYLSKGGSIVVHFGDGGGESTYEKFDSLDELRDLNENGSLRPSINVDLLNDAFEVLGKPFVVEIE